MADFRPSWKNAGKAPKTILIAAARQLLVILNAMLKTAQPLRI
ncbi:hypothetical protein [Oceanicola granulosus]|nr:hypothetical protein [Oceanicola granulosus]